MKDLRVDEVLRHLHPPVGFKPWHGGPTILGALRGVSEQLAAWQPDPGRHSIWELALHVAYWNYAVRRRLTGEPTGGFPRSPSNWPELPKQRGANIWRDDRRLVRSEHDRLVEAIESFDARRLGEISGQGKVAYADLVTGVLLHDTYHVGQIQLLKRLARSWGV
ncbi:MAG: DinB family protein [Acidobacteriota bacterium]|nr:DinB family protein [Acidobacteriota bacterium]